MISIQSTVKETKAVVLHQDSLRKKFLCPSIVPQKDGITEFAYGIRTSVEAAVPCSTKKAIILLFSAKHTCYRISCIHVTELACVKPEKAGKMFKNLNKCYLQLWLSLRRKRYSTTLTYIVDLYLLLLYIVCDPLPRPYLSAVRFLKNHRSEADDFLIKMGVGVLHIRGLSRKGARHCFSLVTY